MPHSCRSLASTEQLREFIVDALDREFRLSLKWLANVGELLLPVLHLSHGEDEVIRLVQCREDFISRDRHRNGVGDPAFHFDETESAVCLNFRFDVVSTLLAANVSWMIAKQPL